MKKIIILFILLATYACSGDENNTPVAPVNDPFEPAQATLLREGTIMASGHSISGTVGVYDDGNQKLVVLDPFSTQNGPDLKVYLSTDQNASEYISLGALKSITGKQTYPIPGTPDLDKYTFVLIWCEQFTVLFGKAEVK